MSPRFPLPPQARLASWAVKYGPVLLPYAKRLYQQGRWRQLAILHARTVDGGQFSWEVLDGERVWVVWRGEEVVATYPGDDEVTATDFPGAREDRRRDPDELTVRRLQRRARRRFGRSRDDDAPDDT